VYCNFIGRKGNSHKTRNLHVLCSKEEDEYIHIYIQHDATLHSLFMSGNCSICFWWYLHPSSGAQITVSTASDTCHTVTAIYRYRERVGTAVK